MLKEADKLFLRVHNFLPTSRANGPGTRAVVWVQGCTLACPGCFNGPTHPTRAGQLVSVASLVEQILSLRSQIEGVTISGGEPLQQKEGVASLLRQIKAGSDLSVILFTGFSWAELERMGRGKLPGAGELDDEAAPALPLPLLEDVDVLIAGRYEAARHLAQDLRGSTNKRSYFLTSRYKASDFKAVPKAEVVIRPNGQIVMSGIDPLRLGS